MRGRPSFLPTLIFLSITSSLAAQTTVRGRITDRSGETVPGATITLKEDPARKAVSDLDGHYTLRLEQPGRATLVIKAFSYHEQEVPLNATSGDVLVQNVELTSESEELKGVEVVAKARRSGDSFLERMRANAPASIDYISRDMMLKTGDSDAASAVKRVSGVSTVGAFVTVRGLADRYLITTVNGGRIPTLDPFTNNLRLDLFPTGLMDNIIITKTLTPDLPGDWAGAYLSLNTSDYPEKLQVQVSSTIGYNPNSTFKDIVSGTTAPGDWTGVDDGTRAIPAGLDGPVENYPRFVDPDLFQQLNVLGLSGYLGSYGITGSTPGMSGAYVMTASPANTVQHLALTELGLLAPALLNDPAAVQSAVAQYNGQYGLAYFSPILNADLAAANARWDNSRWRVGTARGGANHNTTFNIGNRLTLGKQRDEPRELGFLLGFRYASETQNDDHSTMLRTFEPYDDPVPGDQYDRKGEQRVSTITHGWSALGNMSFKLDRNNTFSLMAMGNVQGQSNARHLIFLAPSVNDATFVSEEQFWEQRRLWTAQYGSRHLVPALNLTVTPDLSYSTGERDLLDLKVVQYIQPPPGQTIADVDGALRPPGRIFRFLNEEVLDARLGLELPLSDSKEKVRKLKFGGAYRWNERTNDQRYFVVQGAPGPTQWETPGRFDMQPDGRFISSYVPFGSFKDNDIGILRVQAAYAMADHAFSTRLRVAGGVRVEHTDLISDIRDYHDQQVAADDPQRGTVGDIGIIGANGAEPKPAVPGTIDQWDVLPSVNLIWKLRDAERPAMDLRVGYFRSLSRPSFREFSVVQYYDYQLQAPVYGNPALRMTQVDNADVRIERAFSNGANMSISTFYKHFRDHIELLQTAQGGFTWRNADRSRVFGVELEGRLRFARSYEWRGNLTLMDSRSELSTVLNDQVVDYTTPMFGQAPYIVNSTFMRSLDSLRFDISVSYNVQGPKLAVTNSELDPDGIRAFEMPRHLIDITLNKRFGRHWGLMFRVRDLLNAPIRRTYRFASGHHVDFDRFAFGTEYRLTLSYTIR